MAESTIIKLQDLLAETRNNTAEALKDFINQQKKEWPLAFQNYKGLEKVEEKQFPFDSFTIKVQFNPERIRSSAAKVDEKSIAERKCFLCLEHLPTEQKGIAWGQDFIILVNPFPILKKHFTISHKRHIHQAFFENIENMLRLAADMEGYSLFYNGPECGASAPDHMHFQAGESGFMPVDEEYFNLKPEKGGLLYSKESTEIWSFNNYLRKMISIESADMQKAYHIVQHIYNCFADMQSGKKEPMLNVICRYVNEKWVIHVFPRQLHRPAQYFEKGNKQLLISPASVDFGGVLIMPRREDFEKITTEDIVNIFRQVSVENDFFEQLKSNLTDTLKKHSF